jgi:glutathione peroxidase-family protein
LIETSAYRGKKVIITVLSAGQENLQLVSFLDSVQRANDQVKVIVVPTDEFQGNISSRDLANLKQSLSITITQPLQVRKNKQDHQHPLFVWLTSVQENGHFNTDVKAEGQVFIVNAKGTLYSVLAKGTPLKTIGKVISQPFTE